MSTEAMLRGLLAEQEETLEGILRSAYELGYREGLSASGRPMPSAPPPVESPRPAEPELLAPLFDDDEPDDDDSGPSRSGEAKSRPRGVRASTSVDGLLARIAQTFRLERFDIDVIICRRGDPDRRRLKGSARLSSYLRDED